MADNFARVECTARALAHRLAKIRNSAAEYGGGVDTLSKSVRAARTLRKGLVKNVAGGRTPTKGCKGKVVDGWSGAHGAASGALPKGKRGVEYGCEDDEDDDDDEEEEEEEEKEEEAALFQTPAVARGRATAGHSTTKRSYSDVDDENDDNKQFAILGGNDGGERRAEREVVPWLKKIKFEEGAEEGGWAAWDE